MPSRYKMPSLPAEYLPMALMTAGGCCFGIMDAFAKLLTDVKGVPVAPVVCARMMVTAILASLYMKYQGIEHPILGPPGVRGWLFLRGLIGGCNIFLFYSCLQHLHLEDALSIWFMAPIITSILAALLLREPYTRFEGLCGALSTIGVLLVTHPPLLFGSTGSKLPNQMLGFAESGAGTFCGAVVFVIIRHIGKRCNALFFVSYFGYVSAGVMAIIMVVDETQRPKLAQFDVPAAIYLVGLSFTGFLATYMQNKAIQLAKVGRITLLLYVQLPLVVFLSWAVFGDLMTLLSLAGCTVIVGCAVAITLNNEQKTSEKVVEAAGYDVVEQEDEDIEMPLSETSIRDGESRV